MAIVLVAIACGGDEESSGGSGGDNSTPQEVEVVAKDFSFVPKKLSGAVGQSIEITLSNTGEVSHTFTIDEYNVDTEVPAGEETTVTVLPSEPGEFNYYCRFHQDQGMLGAISTTGEGVAATDSPTEAPAEDPFEY
jgi:plastocyanin